MSHFLTYIYFMQADQNGTNHASSGQPEHRASPYPFSGLVQMKFDMITHCGLYLIKSLIKEVVN